MAASGRFYWISISWMSSLIFCLISSFALALQVQRTWARGLSSCLWSVQNHIEYTPPMFNSVGWKLVGRWRSWRDPPSAHIQYVNYVSLQTPSPSREHATEEEKLSEDFKLAVANPQHTLSFNTWTANLSFVGRDFSDPWYILVEINFKDNGNKASHWRLNHGTSE